MRTVSKIPTSDVKPLRRSKEKDEQLEQFCRIEVEDALSCRSQNDRLWRELLRQYKGIPQEKFTKDIVPIKRIEITIGAMQADTIFGLAYDTIFRSDPILTVRGAPKFEDHAKAFQALANHLIADPFTNFRPACQDFLMDDIQLGTGVLYTIWDEAIRNTGPEIVSDRGSRIYSVSPDDLIVPGGSLATTDLQAMFMVGYRLYLTRGEMQIRASQLGWDINKAKSTDNISLLRRARDTTARTREPNKGLLQYYEIYDLYLNYDYNQDEKDEDLLVTWDRTSGKILALSYDPFDRRPFSVARYQIQGHMFYGMGVLEMTAPFQNEITDWHAFRMANARLANSRAYAVRRGSALAGDNIRIIPNKPLLLDNSDDIRALQMADIYPSALQYEAYSMQLAKERVGNPGAMMQSPRPGHRVPAMTAMALMQQGNRRFAPAFEDMRQALADAVKQAIFRMREQYLMGGARKEFIEDQLSKVLGSDMATRVVEVFKMEGIDLEDAITIEMTASTQTINREADKQNTLMLTQIIGQYYQQIMQISGAISSPQVPPQMKTILLKVAKAMTEAMDRLLRDFDQVRDPSIFLLSEDDIEQLSQDVQGAGQGDMSNLLGNLGVPSQSAPSGPGNQPQEGSQGNPGANQGPPFAA